MKIHDLGWPEGVSLQVAAGRDLLAEQLASQVADQLRQALAEKGRALLVVSGGSTPIPFFQALSHEDLPWDRVDLTLADERWVAENHPDSNTARVKHDLCANRAAAVHWIPLLGEEDLASNSVLGVEARLASLSWPIDVLVLGMGNDGHTASLFPCAEALAQAMWPEQGQRCSRIEPVNAPHARVTLNLPVLLASRHVYLHVVGDDKLKTLQRALGDLSRPLEMPIRSFCRRGLQVYWSP